VALLRAEGAQAIQTNKEYRATRSIPIDLCSSAFICGYRFLPLYASLCLRAFMVQSRGLPWDKGWAGIDLGARGSDLSLMQKRIFLAGAAGAVGRRLCLLLAQEGWQVTGM